MINYYQLCCEHHGKVVTIYDKRGVQHCGRIVRVDRQNVYLETRQRSAALGGFSFGLYGGYYSPYYRPYGYGIVPISLAFIGGFILGSVFFW